VNASFWKSEEGHLVCQWSQAVEPAPYHPSWMREAGQVKPTGAVPAFLDFTRLSPLGGLRRWYDPGTGGFLRQFGNRENSGRIIGWLFCAEYVSRSYHAAWLS